MNAPTGKGQNIRYIAVARLDDRAPLAQYLPSADLSEKLCEEKLDKVLRSTRSKEHARLTITDHEVGTIHYDTDSSCLYLVICAKEYPQRSAFKFLGDLRRGFFEKFGPEVEASRPFALSKVSKPFLKDLSTQYNTVENVDNIANVTLQVNEVKNTMQNNIQTVLSNQENIENLVDKTDTMVNDANTFQRTTGQVKDKMWWRNTKLMIIIGVLLIVLLLVIIIPIIVR